MCHLISVILSRAYPLQANLVYNFGVVSSKRNKLIQQQSVYQSYNSCINQKNRNPEVPCAGARIITLCRLCVSRRGKTHTDKRRPIICQSFVGLLHIVPLPLHCLLIVPLFHRSKFAIFLSNDQPPNLKNCATKPLARNYVTMPQGNQTNAEFRLLRKDRF